MGTGVGPPRGGSATAVDAQLPFAAGTDLLMPGAPSGGGVVNIRFPMMKGRPHPALCGPDPLSQGVDASL